MAITELQVSVLAAAKYGDLAKGGWGPRQRLRFGYYTPDDWYEAVVSDLVKADTRWLDVGCGRELFPSNRQAARVLADRCKLLVGLDPSDNIDDNPFVHERAKCKLEEYVSAAPFDLVTLRMVAEHIAEPEAAMAALARLVGPGGRVVIYTVDRWAPASVISSLTPLGVHHKIKKVLWDAEERDTFPTTYLMNTRRRLRDLASQAGFAEEDFYYLSDTRSTVSHKLANFVELSVWRALRAVGVGYPERCLLGVYRRAA